jgi:hypothetical protein
MTKGIAIAFFMICTLGSCAAAFPYKFYGIVPSTSTLLGPDPKQDLPLSLCEPDDEAKGKCVVLFREEFERLMADYVSTKERLKQCEQNGN